MSHVVNDDDAHPITGERLADEGGYGSDDAPELFTSSTPGSKNNMLSSLLTSEHGNATRSVEPFAEWDSLPTKYLVSDAKSYLAYFKVTTAIWHRYFITLIVNRLNSLPVLNVSTFFHFIMLVSHL